MSSAAPLPDRPREPIERALGDELKPNNDVVETERVELVQRTTDPGTVDDLACSRARVALILRAP